ncbi:MAG: ATP synthase F1 subunit gamma [Ruminococcaceae bacterium]|nr:ATP synthase F1 subunit gamma [Oscillospiraceae bacterium]
MAGNTKLLRQRIKSVNSTLQLTKAMGLVAGSKIRRANEGMQKARQYAKALEKAVSLLCLDGEVKKSVYMQKRERDRTKLVVIAGDRGLAGGYNANVFRLCRNFPDAEIIPIGKKACDRSNTSAVSSEHYSFEEASALSEALCRDFCEGVYDRLGVIYTEYQSVMASEAKVKWLLPLENPKSKETADIVFEPDCLTVLENAVKEYVAGSICAAARESFACEVAARRNAMDSAEKNATQMIENLSLEYNRARQGAITQEITEIVAGSGGDTL